MSSNTPSANQQVFTFIKDWWVILLIAAGFWVYNNPDILPLPDGSADLDPPAPYYPPPTPPGPEPGPEPEPPEPAPAPPDGKVIVVRDYDWEEKVLHASRYKPVLVCFSQPG